MTVVANGEIAPAPAEASPKSTDTGIMKALLEPTVVERPAAATEADIETEEPESDEADTAAAGEAETPGRKHRRAPKWVRELLREEREAAAAQTRKQVLDEVRALGAKIPDTPVTAQAETESPTQKKTLADFDYQQEAYFDYLLEEKVKERDAKAAREREETARTEAKTKFDERVKVWEAKVGDGAWDTVITAPIETSPLLLEMIDGHERDLDIAYWLATNPADANRIAKLGPMAMAKELLRIEGLLDEPDDEEDPLPPKRTTKAPPPPKTVSGAAKATPSPDDDGLSPDERIALWRAQGKKNNQRR